MTDATSPETWRPIAGFDGWYDVSDHGNVRSWRHNKWGRRSEPRPISPGVHTDGRRVVFLKNSQGKGINKKVHALVMEAFAGPRPQGKEVCHNDGNAANNHVSNLRYDTHLANSADTVKHKRSPKGVRNGMHLLTPEQVLAIIADWETGRFYQRELADKHGVRRTTVNNIVHGYTWGWLTGKTPAAA